jgi:predicted transcriptional regulator
MAKHRVQTTEPRKAIAVRLDARQFRRLEALARAAHRTPTNLPEAAVLRDLDARNETARPISMFVADDAEALLPGTLGCSEGESDERYRERSALMDRLFALPDCG